MTRVVIEIRGGNLVFVGSNTDITYHVIDHDNLEANVDGNDPEAINDILKPSEQDLIMSDADVDNYLQKNVDEYLQQLDNGSIKVTTPAEIIGFSEEDLHKAISDFENDFQSEEKNQEYYHLIINGELCRELCDKIESTYLAAGWKTVVCKTSSEKGERGGLTGLQLWR